MLFIISKPISKWVLSMYEPKCLLIEQFMFVEKSVITLICLSLHLKRRMSNLYLEFPRVDHVVMLFSLVNIDFKYNPKCALRSGAPTC